MMDRKRVFSSETTSYLIESFQKAGLKETDVLSIFGWLMKPPKWTTIRLNTLLGTDSDAELVNLQSFLNNSFAQLNSCLKSTDPKRIAPKCYRLNSLIDECFIFDSCSGTSDASGVGVDGKIAKNRKSVIVDTKCAQAVLRGADIFVPGIVGLSTYGKAKDEVSIYADIRGKCRKGADATAFISSRDPSDVYFVGNGWLMLDRDEVFKNNESVAPISSGVGVKVKELTGNYYIPSFDAVDERKFYLQNLPSLVCARVLDPVPNDMILDMCAAPGGKTTHIAQLVNNDCKLLAFDKIGSKVKRMKELCQKFEATCVECICQDGTKINFKQYAPNSFDRILVDAPCSALGQRPLIYNDMTVNQLGSYINYQPGILALPKTRKTPAKRMPVFLVAGRAGMPIYSRRYAIKLLKPGGTLVYSTCTITLEENEEQIAWLLSKYSDIELVSQKPYDYAISGGLPCAGLSADQLALLQRFLPNFTDASQLAKLEANCNSVYFDTNGFFIAKLQKKKQI